MANTSIEELKKIAEQNKIIFGSSEIVRKIKQGKIQKVFLASNVPQEIEEDIEHNAAISKTDIEKITIPNYELGMVFKRAHPVVAMGLLKE